MKPKSGNVVPLREQTEPGVQNAKVVSVSGKEVVIRISGVTQAGLCVTTSATRSVLASSVFMPFLLLKSFRASSTIERHR